MQEFSIYLQELLSWADILRKTAVFANADNEIDANTAVKFGAQGIGLCRTEHMFFAGERIDYVRSMILCKTSAERKIYLDKILEMQVEDFIQNFSIMKDLPVTIRLLDPPLHEFLPKLENEFSKLASLLKINEEEVSLRISALQEVNPMLGHRGCRLAISYPEIYIMQVRAIFTAIENVQRNYNITPKVEIMVPIVSDPNELKFVRELIEGEYLNYTSKNNLDINYFIGTMIELPRSAILAGEIAKYADFLSFGTNDLTQTTYGISRDDAGRFLNDYYDKDIFTHDPFDELDEKGVGFLIQLACDNSRKVKDIKLGVCGEHGGKASAAKFFVETGLTYVSCSPYRIPIIRLALAQEEIKNSSS